MHSKKIKRNPLRGSRCWTSTQELQRRCKYVQGIKGKYDDDESQNAEYQNIIR